MGARTKSHRHIKSILLRSSMLAACAALSPSAAFAQDNGVESVTVTGYEASLENSINAKRSALSFTDSVFAEDIGKFPDANIAESLNRVPGITILRDSDGEGVNVSIRGLGTNFTKILLNGAQISVASTGPIDQQNNNREVDLNMFPTELFTQLTVSKSPSADQLEGGAAGTVNMRSARPFDRPGLHLTGSFQGTDYSHANSLGEKGSVIASDTIGPFGALLGLSAVHSQIFTQGWETGNGGYVNSAALTASQCGAGNTCDSLGGNSYTLGTPAAGGTFVVPAGISYAGPGGQITGGQVIDANFITSQNPGLTTAQFSNALLPKFPRPMFEQGYRDRFNGVLSLEYRPTDDLQFYLDMIGGLTDNNMNRTDSTLGIRAGAASVPIVPVGLNIDANSFITSGTVLGGIYGVEARPYVEHGNFYSVNPGMSWQATDMLHVDFQLNASRSNFFRDAPTFYVVTAPPSQNALIPGPTPPAGGPVSTYTLASPHALTTSNIDINDPANFQWNNGLVRLQDERHITKTQGAHLDAKYGGDEFAVKVGFAYDDAFRQVIGIDPDAQFQSAVCGDNPNVFLPPPNSAPPCQGLTTTTPNAAGVGPGGYSTYPGYGTGYSAGFPAFAYQGSLAPAVSLAKYLRPGPTGFVTMDYAAIEQATNYRTFDQNAINSVGVPRVGSTETYPFSLGAGDTGSQSGMEEERNVGAYFTFNGILHLDARSLKYNFGLRWVQTLQNIISPVAHSDPRNNSLADGGKYPVTYTFLNESHDYAAFLPSANFVYEVTDDFQVRASFSRTMTRPNVNSMIDVVSFGDVAVQNATKGNPDLKPFFSNNIDLGAELYTGGAGYIGLDVFRKSISGFTVTSSFNQTFPYLAQYGITYGTLSPQQQSALDLKTGCGVGCTPGSNAASLPIIVSQQQNAQGLLTINGMELDYSQPLDFLLESYGLPGFGINSNVTIIDQRSSGAVPAIAGGVAPLTYNVAAYYEHNGAMLRFSYTWNDKSYTTGATGGILGLCLPSIAAVSSGCTAGPYFINAPYGQLDMSSSYRLANLFDDVPGDPELTFDIQNLTRSKLRTYEQYSYATNTYYDFGSVYMFGIRAQF
jgi:TonB-dependent receptor